MEFWGCEVPSGQSVDCPVSNGYVHLSHVALGDTKNAVDNEKVIIRVKHRNQDLVLGTFVRGKCDQIVLDLLFHKQFTLSHNSKHSTIYFAGYKTDNLDPEKPATPAVAQNGKLALEASDDDSVDDDDSDGMMLEDDDDDEDFDDDRTRKIYSYADGDDDDDDDEDDDDGDDDDDDDDDDSMDDESDEELVLPTPKSDKKKKRPADSPAAVTPPADKKIKASAGKSVAGGASLSKNQKQQQQKEIETTPASDKKKANKNIKDTKDTPVNTPKTDSKKKGSVTPVSDGKVATKPGQYHCKDCVRNFSNEGALTQHNSAKHKK